MLLAARITITCFWKTAVVHLDYVKHTLNWIIVNDKLELGSLVWKEPTTGDS